LRRSHLLVGPSDSIAPSSIAMSATPSKAGGDSPVIHGVNCLMSAQELASQGVEPPKTPVEFANFVAETAPPEVKEHFKAQADAILKFSKGEMSYSQMRSLCG
jgi:hypothetical protein